MPTKIDYTDCVFGRWTVLRDSLTRVRPRYVLCRCECGTEKEVSLQSLKEGDSKSCGCYQKEVQTSHSLSRSATYRSWDSMKQRCLNTNHKNYSNYGGRGIKVCDRWLNSFENFYEDMGERPEGTSLDRINGSGDYTISNCRWADRQTQSVNTRKREGCTSSYKGVSFNHNEGKWLSQITREGITRHLGYFTNEEEAGEAYLKASEGYEIYGKI